MRMWHSAARLRKGSHLLALCTVAASLGFATHKHRLPVQYTPRSSGTANLAVTTSARVAGRFGIAQRSSSEYQRAQVWYCGELPVRRQARRGAAGGGRFEATLWVLQADCVWYRECSNSYHTPNGLWVLTGLSDSLNDSTNSL